MDLAALAGGGPGGRVTADDVEPREQKRAARMLRGRQADAVSSIRRTIARRLEQAAAIPQVTTFRTVDATALEVARAVSPLPIVVAAICRTIGSHPLLNASWSDDAIVTHQAVHVGIAVDTDRGLIVRSSATPRPARSRSRRRDRPASRRPRARARSIRGRRRRHDLGEQHGELQGRPARRC